MGAISVRLDDETLERLDRLGGRLARARSWLIAQAVQRYLDDEEWFVDAVRQGMESADAGRTVGHGDVARWVERWDTGEKTMRPE